VYAALLRLCQANKTSESPVVGFTSDQVAAEMVEIRNDPDSDNEGLSFDRYANREKEFAESILPRLVSNPKDPNYKIKMKIVVVEGQQRRQTLYYINNDEFSFSFSKLMIRR